MNAEQKNDTSQTNIFLGVGYAWWFFSIVFGAPSVLAIAEALFDGFEISSPFSYVIDLYRRLVSTLDGILRPLILIPLEYVNDFFGVKLSFDPMWSYLFGLAMLFVSAIARAFWIFSNTSKAMNFFIFGTLQFLFLSIIFGIFATPFYEFVPIPMNTKIMVSILAFVFPIAIAIPALAGPLDDQEDADVYKKGVVMYLGAYIAALIIFVADFAFS